MGNNTNAPEGPRPDDCAAWVAFAAAVLGGSWNAEVNAEHFAAEAAAAAGAMLGHYREFRRRLEQQAEADAATEAEALAGGQAMIGAHIPTGPGWYWWLADHAADPVSDAYPVQVLPSRAGGLVAWLTHDDGGPTPVNETPGEFLAPIPSPAVCAALAAYRAAVDERDGEEEARIRRTLEGGNNSATVLAEFVEEVEYRAEMLADALRAERDGAA